jgi:hypothetical protein
MATTTNYSWSTPDDTALVKDGAAAIRTLGSSVDTTVKALNPETTLGDIAYRSSTANVKTRLGLGTAGQVLTVNSGANAPEWATPAGGGDNFVALNGAGTALSGSNSVSVTGLSGNNILYFFIYGGSSSAATTPRITLNSDATSKYSASSLDLTSPATYNSSMIGVSFNGINGEDKLVLGGFGAASEQCIIFGTIFGANSTGAKIINTVSAFNAGASAISKVQQNIYTGSSVISSIQFINGGSGTWDAGNVYVYGSA